MLPGNRHNFTKEGRPGGQRPALAAITVKIMIGFYYLSKLVGLRQTHVKKGVTGRMPAESKCRDLIRMVKA